MQKEKQDKILSLNNTIDRWYKFYILLGTINFIVYLVPVIMTGYFAFLLFGAPAFIVTFLAFFVYITRDLKSASIFLIIYTFIVILQIGMIPNNIPGAILYVLFTAGLFGAFHCFFSLKILKKLQKNEE